MDLGTRGTRGQVHHDVLLPASTPDNNSKTAASASAMAVATTINSLETVRALHQTVVSLRTALEQSRAELHSLRLQFQSKVDPAVYTSTIEKLSLENHILRQRVISSSHGNISSLFSINSSPLLLVNSSTSMEPEKGDKPDGIVKSLQNGDENKNDGTSDEGGGVVCDDDVTGIDDVFVGDHEDGEKKLLEEGDQSLSSADTSTTPKIMKGESEESEELDDIELIFTTEDTKELSEFQEDLVSIAETEGWQKGTQDKCDRLKKMWTTHSVLVETDISKCGVVDENDSVIIDQARRNTLPNPTPYRPIIHREALTGSKSQLVDGAPGSPRPVAVKFSQNVTKSPKTMRPILVENNSTKQESEAQTDITALPAHWRSESYLAHKVSHNFTTLPSKFALPVQSPPPRKHSLKLCEKTQEARRVLLSDINFTSMVPELSRSADHLCNEAINASVLCKNYPRAFSYMKNPDSVMSPSYLSRAPWSPCDCSHRQSSWECYHSSATSMHSPSAIDLVDGTKRRHSMRPSTSSTDTYWGSVTSRPNWSVPSSPTHCRRSCSIPLNRTDSSFSYGRPESCNPRRSDSRFISSCGQAVSATTRTKNKVTFQDSVIRRPGRSLPDLRLTVDLDSGEDSTDSLIDESEEFLRRSIDSMMTGSDFYHLSSGGAGSARHRSRHHHHHHHQRHFSARRHSDPDPVREFEPPKSAQPFLAKVPRDLKLDYWVKVISSEGKVIVGRIRYIGPVAGQTDTFVGVQLPHGEGNSDGTFDGRRYFD
ncbi:uncharacterized protein LOC142324781 isoform X2 [Lycorma delicatula]